jgi:hypothetical protein
MVGRDTQKATAFGGARTCPLFRKSVEFELPADARLLLQLHGSGRDSVRLSIVPSDGHGEYKATR